MFRRLSETEHEEMAEGGVRHLFRLDHFEFRDALDAEGEIRHLVVEGSGGDGEPTAYQADRDSMYEFMARYLAGEYEKAEYALERSPAHEALLDLLELATARARGGESDFGIDELEESGGEEGEESA